MPSRCLGLAPQHAHHYMTACGIFALQCIIIVGTCTVAAMWICLSPCALHRCPFASLSTCATVLLCTLAVCLLTQSCAAPLPSMAFQPFASDFPSFPSQPQVGTRFALNFLLTVHLCPSIGLGRLLLFCRMGFPGLGFCGSTASRVLLMASMHCHCHRAFPLPCTCSLLGFVSFPGFQDPEPLDLNPPFHAHLHCTLYFCNHLSVHWSP